MARLHIKKNAFSMVEALISLSIVSVLTLLFLPIKFSINLSWRYFISDYLAIQSRALSYYEKIDYPNIYSSYPVYFNENGSINMAQTIEVDGKKLIAHLGNGYLSYE